MSFFQERIIKFLNKGLSDGSLTLDDYNTLIVTLKKAEKIVTIHPELYAGLLEDSFKFLSEMTKKAEKEISELKEIIKAKGLKIKNVAIDEEKWSLKALGADASSCPVPMGLTKVALISAMAFREGLSPVIMRDLISIPNNAMTSREFKIYYQTQAEMLIPVACIKHIESHGKPDYVIIDGPLSASSLLRKIPRRSNLKSEVYREMQEKAHQLIRIRDQLVQKCYETNIPIFAVVKRCVSRHFMAWYELKDSFPYTDQFVFQQLLDYGQRTQSISISRAIEKQGAEPFASFNEIYGFYIKTSRNPLTPPIRIEYPEFLKEKEDWIASCVLTTSLTTHETEFDGLPRVICLVHKDAKITREIMKEIYRRGITKMLSEKVSIKLLGLMWGVSIE